MCGYDRVAGKNALGTSTGLGAVTLTAASGSDQGHIVASFAEPGAATITEGHADRLDGCQCRRQRTISSAVVAGAAYTSAFLFPIAIGDTFTVLPGCDHTMATCNGTYQNLGRFGGFPWISPPKWGVAE